jgi:hypothetical protein
VGPLPRGRPPPVWGVQRATDSVSPGLGAGLAGHVGADLTGVAVHRDEEAGRSADELRARAFTTAGEVHLPARQGPLEAQPGRALLAHELVHVAQQRLLGPARPAEQTPAGQDLERQAVAVERAVAGHGEPEPPAGPAAGFPLAQLSAAEVLDPRSTALASGAARLDRDGSVVFRPPPGPAQRAPEEPTAPPPTAWEPSAAAGAPAGDLDELARRLYERIRLRLKVELRLDRERSGHLTDLWH